MLGERGALDLVGPESVTMNEVTEPIQDQPNPTPHGLLPTMSDIPLFHYCIFAAALLKASAADTSHSAAARIRAEICFLMSGSANFLRVVSVCS